MRSFTFVTLFIAAVSNAQLIQPSSVPQATRDYWCNQQQTQCPLLCAQISKGTTGTIANDCDASTLVYQCVCANGQSPNSTEYSQTIPYFECTENNNRCVNDCGLNDTPCQSACRQNNPCGASDPRRYTLTSTATTPYVSPTLPAGYSASSMAFPTGAGGNGGSSDGGMASFNGDTGGSGAAGRFDVQVVGMAVAVGGAAFGVAFLL